MRTKLSYTVDVRLVDHDGTRIESASMARKLDGLACVTDSALNYVELGFSEETGLRGGFPRLVIGDAGKLLLAIEVDAERPLTRSELKALREDLDGQATDGIGAGCFDALSAATGIGVEVAFPLRSRCRQEQGTAWKPRATTQGGNERRIAAAAALVGKADSKPKRPTPSASAASAGRAAPEGDSAKPNFQKLFRLLAKPERDQLFDAIKTELAACGNDLSRVEDGQLPFGNWSPKLLRLLLDAGLRPETIDVKGHTLLIQAAAYAKSLELLLRAGADVNRVCNTFDATALQRAARLGKKASVELLLQNGADAGIENSAGRTALQLVDPYSRHRKEIEAMLQ